MKRATPQLVLGILLVLALLTPAAAGLFGPPSMVFKGQINFIQPTNFTVLAPNNVIVRIMVPTSQRIPAEVQLGVRVEVKAILGQDGLWYLDKFEKIELQPTP